MKKTKLTARDRAVARRKEAVEAYELAYMAWPETSEKWGNQFVEQQLRRLADEMVQAVQADLQAEMDEAKAWAELSAAQDALKAARYAHEQAGWAFPETRLALYSALCEAESAESLALFRLGEVRS
jgi:hypothetical protein